MAVEVKNKLQQQPVKFQKCCHLVMKHQRQVAENGKLLARGDELLAAPAHNGQEEAGKAQHPQEIPRKTAGKPSRKTGSWQRVKRSVPDRI